MELEKGQAEVKERGKRQNELEELYLSYKGYAFSIAYRLLGVVADAEDAVQDSFMELQRRGLGGIENLKAYLAKSITNRCLNQLQSARSRRETYIGEWLPEPLIEAYDSPEAAAERNDTLSYAFLVLLERFTPVERAVFVLREVFEYDYESIADMVDKSAAACRQIFSRASRNFKASASAEHGGSAAGPSRAVLLKRFTAAFEAYDVGAMLELLAEQPVLIADGGGQEVHTILRPMAGQRGVLALLTSHRVLRELRSWQSEIVRINGEPNLLFRQDGEVAGMLCLEFTGDKIQQLYLIVEPDKLRTFGYSKTR